MAPKGAFEKLHTNQRILVETLLEKGASCSIEDLDKEIVRVRYKGKDWYLSDRFTEKVPFNWVDMTASKNFVKKLLLENGISMPLGDIFSGKMETILYAYAKELGYPVVLKPDWGSHGDFVSVDIRDEKELKKITKEFFKEYGKETSFLVEEYFEGTEHRIFITQKGDYAVLKREPAHVIGNGMQSLEELILSENKRRTKLKQTKNTSLCPLAVDAQVLTHLKKTGKTLSSIPKDNEKVYLRKTSNIAKGGKSYNVTKQTHPSVIAIAKRIAKAIPLPMMGIDFMTQDIEKTQDLGTYRVLEVNSSPGFAMHMFPTEGTPINVAEYAIKVLF